MIVSFEPGVAAPTSTSRLVVAPTSDNTHPGETVGPSE